MRFRQIIRLNEQEMRYAAGVCIYCPRTGRFLLQKRGPNVEDPGQHDWFGGGSDPGEDIETTAVRELEEEGGIKVSPESLYPLARFGYEPSKGLGGYHIYLLIVDDEFECNPNFDGDTNDEVESADWIGVDEWKNIDPHERVYVLFSDPQFKDTLKNAFHDRVESGHVAKLRQQTNEDWRDYVPTKTLGAAALGLGIAAGGMTAPDKAPQEPQAQHQTVQQQQSFDYNLRPVGGGNIPDQFQVTSPQYGSVTISRAERSEVMQQAKEYGKMKALQWAQNQERGPRLRAKMRRMRDSYTAWAESYYMEELLKSKTRGA